MTLASQGLRCVSTFDVVTRLKQIAFGIARGKVVDDGSTAWCKQSAILMSGLSLLIGKAALLFGAVGVRVCLAA